MNEHDSRTSASSGMTSTAREAAVVATFIELTNTLVGDYDVVEVLDHLVQTCVDILDISAAGMLLMDRGSGRLRVAAASSDSMRILEVFQVQHSEGPCPDCVAAGEQVVCDDLGSDPRWPEFRPVALAAGCLAVTAVPVRWRGQRIGALGLFGSTPRALKTDDRLLAQAFADAAAIGLTHQHATQDSESLNQQLRGALDSRVVIEQAKGVIAERGRMSVQQAFDVLRNHSRNHNTKIAGVSRAVVEGRLILPLADDRPR